MRATPIAHAAHGVSAPHRGVGPRDAGAEARRPDVAQFLPGLERMATSASMGHAVDNATASQDFPESLAVMGPVGEKTRFVALDARLGLARFMQIGRRQLGLAPETASSSTARCDL